jgi:hypothetical protein
MRRTPSPPEYMPRKGHFFWAGRSEVPADLASPRLCERLGYTIVQEYTDSGISGAKVVMTDLLQTLSRKILLVVALTW